MWNLLRANFVRLGKSLVFWVCAAVLLFAACRRGAFELILSRDPGFNTAWDRWSISLFGEVRDLLPFAAAAFVSLFLSGEHDGNPIRNKLIPGHSRGKVYGAALITVTAGVLLLFLLYTGAMAVFLRISFGPFLEPSVPGDLAAIAAMWVAWGALFTAIGLNCTAPAISVVLCLGTYGLLRLITYTFDPLLQRNQVEFRAILCPFLYDFLPTGQGDQLRGVDRVARWDLIPYALLFAGIASGVGALVFCRKDMK